MAELKYEIVKNLGVLSQSPSGWTKELNLVSWNVSGRRSIPKWGRA